MPYSFLQTMIKERNIKHKTIQNELGISKTMFSRKINGSRNGKFTLEEALEFIEDDEYIEVTPDEIRLRKKYLDPKERYRRSH